MREQLEAIKFQVVKVELHVHYRYNVHYRCHIERYHRYAGQMHQGRRAWATAKVNDRTISHFSFTCFSSVAVGNISTASEPSLPPVPSSPLSTLASSSLLCRSTLDSPGKAGR